MLLAKSTEVVARPELAALRVVETPRLEATQPPDQTAAPRADSGPSGGEQAQAAPDTLLLRRNERLKMLPVVAVSYAVDTVLLLGYCATGTIPWIVPVVFLPSGLLLCFAFHLILGSGIPDRMRDHHMVLEQIVANCTLLMAFLMWVPQVGASLMMLSFVIFAWGALRMKFRRVVVGSMGVALAMGLLVGLNAQGVALPFDTPGQRAVTGVWFVVVLCRLSALGQYGARLRGLLTEQRAQLAVALADVERLANRDELTGAMNRRAIMARVSEERDRMRRTGVPFAVALFDIDLFKRVNDGYGHLIGDEVLRRFSIAALGAIRETDRLGRFGGEEFLVLMPATDREEAALAAANRVREAVTGVAWSTVDASLDVTVSAGVGVARPGDTVESLLGRADSALYAAKRDGRNCVRAA